MKKIVLIVFLFNFTLFMSIALFASEGVSKPEENDAVTKINPDIAKYISAAVAIGVATLSSGLAIGKIGSAAMGAVSERPEAGGPALILAALAEGVSLWGFLIAFFILQS